MVAAAPGRQDPLPVNNPLQGRQGLQPGIPGHRRDSSPPHGKTDHRRDSNPPHGRTGHRQDSSLRPGNNPRSRTALPTAIPGPNHQVPAMRAEILTQGAREHNVRSNTSRADPVTSPTGPRLPALPPPHDQQHHPGPAPVVPHLVPEDDKKGQVMAYCCGSLISDGSDLRY